MRLMMCLLGLRPVEKPPGVARIGSLWSFSPAPLHRPHAPSPISLFVSPPKRERAQRACFGRSRTACGPAPGHPTSVDPRWATPLLTISCPRSPANELPGSQEKQCREYGIIGGLLQPCGCVLPVLSSPCLGPPSPSQTPQTSAICGKQVP